MVEFGFEGERGYVQLQTALMDHAQDPIVMNNVGASTMRVFERAGLPMDGISSS